MIECLFAEHLLDFLDMLPPEMWRHDEASDTYYIETINNGTRAWVLDPVKDLYCHWKI
jgi:hypothetical protein